MCVNNAAGDWLGTLTAPEPSEQVPSQDDHPWNPQSRTTTETVQSQEVVQALVPHAAILLILEYVYQYYIWYHGSQRIPNSSRYCQYADNAH